MIKPGTRGFVGKRAAVVWHADSLDVMGQRVLVVQYPDEKGSAFAIHPEDFTPAKHDIPGEEDAA